MKKSLTLLSLCTLFLLFSCTEPSGVEVTKYFDAPESYYHLYVGDGIDVVVSNKVDQIKITADENVMEKIIVSYSNGTLSIHRTSYSIFGLLTAQVLLPYNPNLHDVDVENCSSFTTTFGLEGETVNIEGSSQSIINVNYILADQLVIDLESSSKITADVDVFDKMDLFLDNSKADLTGSTIDLQLNMSSNAAIIKNWSSGGYEFACDYCYGSMNNSKAYLHCYDEIAVDLTFNSYLYCTGNPYIEESTWDDSSSIILE